MKYYVLRTRESNSALLIKVAKIVLVTGLPGVDTISIRRIFQRQNLFPTLPDEQDDESPPV